MLALLAFLAFAATFAQILLLDRCTAFFLLLLILDPEKYLESVAGRLRLVSSSSGLGSFSLASIPSSWPLSSTGSPLSLTWNNFSFQAGAPRFDGREGHIGIASLEGWIWRYLVEMFI